MIRATSIAVGALLLGMAGPVFSQNAVPGQPFRADLGAGVVMEMKWIPALQGWAGMYEVTNEQYRRFRARHFSGFFRNYSLDGDQQPVVRVPLEDLELGALPFARWLTRLERAAGRISEQYAYRLPTPVEWRRLARVAEDAPYPWGREWPPPYGNYADRVTEPYLGPAQAIPGYRDGHVASCPVQESGAHPSGLYGLGGNVWEWTEAPGEPRGLALGGSWMDHEEANLRISAQHRITRTYSYEGLGFRLLLMPVEP